MDVLSTTFPIPHVVDYRGLAIRDDSRAVVKALDALAPGECARLIFTDPPRRPLEVLQRARRGAFDWLPLREGPTAWIIELRRRSAAVGAPREVSEMMGWDHARLGELEAVAFEARIARRFEAASEAFAWFAHGLRRHIDVEESLLFPEFEVRSGIGGENSITDVLRAEHRAVKGVLDLVEREIADPEAPAELARGALRRFLAAHALKEDHMLYPAIDRLLSPDESDRMVARIQAWPGRACPATVAR